MRHLEMQRPGCGRVLVREDKYHEHKLEGFEPCSESDVAIAKEIESDVVERENSPEAIEKLEETIAFNTEDE